MLINKKKSALMLIKGRNSESTIDEYPVVNSYRYLGTELDRNCDVMTHVKTISPKINFLTFRFGVLRHRNNMKLNINLFEIFIKPLFRLGYTLYKMAATKAKEQFLKFMRVKWKIFVGIPLTTANRVMNKMFGDIGAEIERSMHNCRRNRERHRGIEEEIRRI